MNVTDQILGEADGGELNALSDLADDVERMASRIAGLVPRRQNTELTGEPARQVIQKLSAARDLLHDAVEMIDARPR